ncbi:hypothetical protein P0082_08400 [Candidatus Haliotispira prima]|uniref:Uncharacterized protein n=1 Tax=Candidatus Haliotispira prima TaxID=3034016 RepID=A0ABY8MH61_9SPIO|nr:hypothetical protein P0082_08400 [Candidatus Haliotispira prima]
MVLSGCVPLSETSDPPAASKSSISFSTAAVVSSVQLEMSSSFAITNIGAVIRLATEAAPTKTEAEANVGYLRLAIAAGSPRKFSISQHYGSDFTNGLTLADVLASNTDYKLYLFFEAGAIPSGTVVEGATLANDGTALSFTTAALPTAGDAIWDSSWTNKQFVGSLPEWGYSENQKGVFVAYTKINIFFEVVGFHSFKADNTSLLQSIGSFSIGFPIADPGFLFNLSKLGGSYPDADDYYYVIASDDTEKILGKSSLELEITGTPPPSTEGGTTKSITVELRAPLMRYSSP